MWLGGDKTCRECLITVGNLLGIKINGVWSFWDSTWHIVDFFFFLHLVCFPINLNLIQVELRAYLNVTQIICSSNILQWMVSGCATGDWAGVTSGNQNLVG